MDYWKDLDVTTYVDYEDFLARNPGAKNYYATTKAPNVYTEDSYEVDCYIMFGKESAGIPEDILVNIQKILMKWTAILCLEKRAPESRRIFS